MNIPTAEKPKVAMVVASPTTLHAFMKHQIARLADTYEVTLIANADAEQAERLRAMGRDVRVVPIKICRQVNLLRDVLALVALWRLFRRDSFHLVHSVTPKAGLLAMTAAWAARVPVRLHTFTGQVWATRNGPPRWLLKSFDRFTASRCTRVLVDSGSQRQFLIEQRVIRPECSDVLAYGSISGVDSRRFRPDAQLRRSVRSELVVGDDCLLLLFVGRLTADKGVLDLAQAFAALARRYPHLLLAVAGPDEENLQERLLQIVPQSLHHRLRLLPFTDAPQRLMAAADVFCLPSYREGFGSVIIEAAACGIPAVASRIYGLTDAVDDEATGLLHQPGSPADLARQLTRLIESQALRAQLAAQARRRALDRFSQSRLTAALATLYARLLGPAFAPAPVRSARPQQPLLRRSA